MQWLVWVLAALNFESRLNRKYLPFASPPIKVLFAKLLGRWSSLKLARAWASFPEEEEGEEDWQVAKPHLVLLQQQLALSQLAGIFNKIL